MIIVFDLRSVGDGEPDLPKAAHDVFCDLRQRMQASDSAPSSRQRKIRRLFRQAGFEFQIGAPLLERCLQPGFRKIDEFADGRPFLLWKRAELFHEGRELTMRTEI